MMSTTFGVSPLASVLIDRIGIQTTAFIGSGMMTVGIFSSGFVPTLDYLYVTLGMMFGGGASLVYNPAILILGQYFETRIGIVNGIVCFGSSFATILLPFFLTEVRKCILTLKISHNAAFSTESNSVGSCQGLGFLGVGLLIITVTPRAKLTPSLQPIIDASVGQR